MTSLKEIGECLVIDGDVEYFFRPSLIAMSSIGEPGEIVSTFHALHSNEATTLLRRAYDAYGAIPHWVIEHAKRTEFTMLLAAKYPDQKGFTRDEYDKVADDYFERKAKRLRKAA